MGLAEHPQGDAAPERAARLPVHPRPGGLRPAVPRAVPGRGGRFPPVPGRGAIAARRGARRHARRQHARRRDVRPADALRQGVLSRQARRRRDDRLATRHLRPPRPDAATDDARRVQDLLVLPRRAPAGLPLGVLLGRDRRHPDRRLLAAVRLRARVSHPEGPAGFRQVADRPLQRPDANSRGRPTASASRAPMSPSPRSTSSRTSRRSTRTPKPPFTIKVAVPADFEAVAARRTDRTVFKGELNPIFQGIYSSRIELKNWMRVMERQLLTAEKLSDVAAWLGSPADPAAILAAWEPVLFNQTHDLASGVMTDHVYEDTIRSYEYAERRSDDDHRRELGCPRLADRQPGAGDSGRRLQPAGMARSESPRSKSASAKGASPGSTYRSRRPGRAGRRSSNQPVSRRRAEDGAGRVHRPRRARPGIRTYHAEPKVVHAGTDRPNPAVPTAGPRAGKRPVPRDARPATRRDHELHVKPGDWECSPGAATSWPGSKTGATCGSPITA